MPNPHPKPSQYSEWASAADPGDVADPTLAVRQAGWPMGGVPPHTWWNWVWQKTDEWVKWLAGAIAQDEGWYLPTVQTSTGVPVSPSDVNSGSRVWWRKVGTTVFLSFDVAWTNTNGVLNANTAHISLPYKQLDEGQSADVFEVWSGHTDVYLSVWPNKATDRKLIPYISTSNVPSTDPRFYLRRIDDQNTNQGILLIGNSAIRVVGRVRYVTDGVYLL